MNVRRSAVIGRALKSEFVVAEPVKPRLDRTRPHTEVAAPRF